MSADTRPSTGEPPDGGFRSFSDPDTHFVVVESDTPVTVDGYAKGEPTGEIKCAICGAVAGAPEYIPHNPVDGEPCPQDDVTSEYYERTH